MEVQQLRLCTFNAGVKGLNSDQGIEISCMLCGQTKRDYKFIRSTSENTQHKVSNWGDNFYKGGKIWAGLLDHKKSSLLEEWYSFRSVWSRWLKRKDGAKIWKFTEIGIGLWFSKQLVTIKPEKKHVYVCSL